MYKDSQFRFLFSSTIIHLVPAANICKNDSLEDAAYKTRPSELRRSVASDRSSVGAMLPNVFVSIDANVNKTKCSQPRSSFSPELWCWQDLLLQERTYRSGVASPSAKRSSQDSRAGIAPSRGRGATGPGLRPVPYALTRRDRSTEFVV